MIDGLKPYPAYKDSGMPWLGQVPEHWEVQRGKWLFHHKKQINADRASTNVLSLTLRGVVNNDPDDPEGLVPKDYATYQLFNRGDLVFKLIDLENLRTSRVGLVHEDGIMSSAYVRLVPHSPAEVRYFFWQYFDLYQRGIYNQLGAGVRSTLGPSDLLNLSVVVPPLPEQAAIVRFLDHVDRRIRRYIRAKQKQIKLLEELKAAIINRAVTRGLDPNVRLKPSGVEWLGDVPEHWEVVPLKRAFSRMDYGISDSGSDGGVIPVLTMGHIQNGVVTVPERGGVDRVEPDLLLQDKDLLFNRTNSAELVAKVGLFRSVGRPVTFASYLVRMRSHGANSPEFLSLVLNSPAFLGSARREAIPSLHQSNLNPTRYGRLSIPLPPAQEQWKIVDAVVERTSSLNDTAASARREIDLLREFRTRLIADVVTGKLDARESAARLPQASEDLEPLDETEIESEELEIVAGDADDATEEVAA
jgi:type I restriction enzyme S subunit